MPIIIQTTSSKIEELSKMCHEHDEPIFLTEDGYGDLVAMSPEVFERF